MDTSENVGISETLTMIEEARGKYVYGIERNESRTVREAICIFDKIVMNRNLLGTLRVRALTTFLKIAPEESADRIARIRDSIRFLDDDSAQREIDVLMHIVSSPNVSSHEKLSCAIALYNLGNLSECYVMFEHIAEDVSVLINYRVEACFYLIYSSVYEYVELGKTLISLFASADEYPSEYRYKTIASFITTTGVATMMNAGRLDVEYDEEFLKSLQIPFFNDPKNGVRERILSGQHLLGMSQEVMSDDEKDKVQNTLLEFACDSTLDANERADAADVVVRMGSEDVTERAQQIIANLGYAKTQGIKTVYSNAQNVHNSAIYASAIEYIEGAANEILMRTIPFESAHADATALIYELCAGSKERTKAFKSLNRIAIDTATYSKRKISGIDIFSHIWNRIVNRNNEAETEELKTRFVQELTEMADTCSSGHALRLVNVLSAYDVELKISFRDQIHSNVSARLNKRIEGIEDAQLRDAIILGMSESGEDSEKTSFLEFLSSQELSLRDELFNEFVGGEYVSKDEFTAYFEEALKEMRDAIKA